MIPPWMASRELGAAGEDVADRRGGVGVDVEIVRQVALRVEVDREHAQLEPAEHVGQGPDRRRLARPALLREDRDRGHRRGTIWPGDSAAPVVRVARAGDRSSAGGGRAPCSRGVD